MDFIQIIFGRYLLEVLGAFVRYVYLNILGLFKRVNYVPFSKLWSPKGNVERKKGNSELNHMIGVISFGVIVFSLVFFLY